MSDLFGNHINLLVFPRGCSNTYATKLVNLHVIFWQCASSDLSTHSRNPLHCPRNEIVSPEPHTKYRPLSVSPATVKVPLDNSGEIVALNSTPIQLGNT